MKSILNQDGQKVAQIGTLGVIADGLGHLDTLTTPDPITLHKLFLELNDVSSRIDKLILDMEENSMKLIDQLHDSKVVK